MNKKKLVKRNLHIKKETKTTIKWYASKVVTQLNIWQLVYKKKYYAKKTNKRKDWEKNEKIKSTYIKKKFIIKDLEKKMQYGPIWINRKLKNHD
jgi:hypothetical protein